MSVLGLISSPVFADTTKHKHHTAHHHHHRAHHVAQSHDYKDSGALVAPAPVVMVQQVDTHQIIYDGMSQNIGRSKQALPDWFNRIGIAGGANADFHWGNRSQGYEGENRQRISLNDGYLNVGANVNDWSKAFMSLSYNNANGQLAGAPLAGQYSNVYLPNGQLNLEQGYVTIANYDVSPFFFQVGKQFTDYGRYTIHPLQRSLTQVMTESLQASAKLGFITQMGLHGDVYAFDNSARAVTQRHTATIYGAALGYDQLNDQLGFDVGVSYMSNIMGVSDIAAALGNGFANSGIYRHLVGGIAAYGDVNSGPFSFAARYTTALQSFNPADLSNQYGLATGQGAKPWTADFTAGFGFNAWTKNQNIYVSYQTGNNAVNLALPKNRYLAGYNIDMWKYTNVGLEVAHDTAYSSGNGGQGRSSNTIGARASVKFG